MESRTKNGIRNIVAGLINQVAAILIPFIVRTVFIYTMGSSYLGLSSLFTSILTVLNLSELGFGSALVFSMYKPIASGDKRKIGALLNLYRKIYLAVGMGVMAVGTLLAPLLPFLIKEQWPQEINIYVLYFIYLTNTAISYIFFAHKKALLTAYQRSDIISNIATMTTIATNLIQLAILLLAHNYYMYVFVYLIFTVIDNLVACILANKLYPGIKCSGRVSQKDKEQIRKHVIGIAFQKFCSTSRNSFDSIVISMFLGLTSIAVYSNYYYIMSSIHAFLYQIPNAIRASVGNSIASTSEEKNYSDFNSMGLIYTWICGWCTVCLLCLYQPFMELWMGPSLMLPMGSVILLCIYFFDLGLSDIIALYKDGAGLWWLGRFRTVLEAVCNLFLNFLLGWIWGINGIILASVLTLIFIGHGYGGYIVFHGYFKSYKYKTYVMQQIGYYCVTAVAAVVTYFVCGFVADSGIASFLAKGLVCAAIPNIIFFVILRKSKNYKAAVLFAKNILANGINNKQN